MNLDPDRLEMRDVKEQCFMTFHSDGSRSRGRRLLYGRRIDRSAPVDGRPRSQHANRRIACVLEQLPQSGHSQGVRHPSVRLVRVVLDDQEAEGAFHLRLAGANEPGRIRNVVQRVGHQDAIEVGERPRLTGEVTMVGGDPHTMVR